MRRFGRGSGCIRTDIDAVPDLVVDDGLPDEGRQTACEEFVAEAVCPRRTGERGDVNTISRLPDGLLFSAVRRVGPVGRFSPAPGDRPLQAGSRARVERSEGLTLYLSQSD